MKLALLCAVACVAPPVLAQTSGNISPQPVVSITAPDNLAAETAAGQTINAGHFLITRSGNTNAAITVAWSISGTASGSADFQPIPTSVTMGPGQTRVEIPLRPVDDSAVEPEESVVLRLLTPPCAQLLPLSPDCWVVGSSVEAMVRIADNDTSTPAPAPVITLETASSAAWESAAGATGSGTNRLSFLLRRHQNTAGSLTVGLQWGGGATRGLDYQAPEFVAFASGQAEAVVHAYPLQDALVEGDEQVSVALRPCASNTTSLCYVVGTPSIGGGVIRDDDPAPPPFVLPVISVDTAAGESAEGVPGANSASGALSFVLRRRDNTSGQTTVYLRWAGTATRGQDYQGGPEQVVFASGQSQINLPVLPVQDTLVEGDETVTVSIAPVNCPTVTTATVSTSCYAVGVPAAASGVIHDDDRPAENRPPYVAWMAPAPGSSFMAPDELRLAASATDPDGFVRRLTFLAEGAPIGTVTNPAPTLASFAGTASTALYEWLWSRPAPGEYHLQAEAADDDGAVSRTPAITVFIRPATNLPLTVVSVTAVDREAAEPGPAATNPNSGLFRVRREGDLTVALDVFYQVGGTASNGVDYAALPGVARFAAGQATVDVPVHASADTLAEGPESVRVSLVAPGCAPVLPPPPDCYRVGAPGADQVVIADAQAAENRLPVVQVVNPWHGQVFRAPADIRLVAEAWDGDGTVSQVEFFSGEISLGIAVPEEAFTNNLATAGGLVAPRPSHPRFQLPWTGVTAGRHVIRAVATDDDGARGVSRPAEIMVVDIQAPVTVTLTVSDSRASETAANTGEPDTAGFMLHRTGPTNLPLRVFLQLGGRAMPGADYAKPEFSGVVIPAGERSAPFVVTPLDDEQPEGPESVEVAVVPPRWLATADGGSLLPIQYVVGEPARGAAVLMDNDVPATNLLPRVRLVRPEPHGIFPAPARVGISAEAFDLDGSVTLVEFFAGNVKVGAQPGLAAGTSNSTYNLVWENAPAGEHALRAAATDNRGAVAQSEAVRILVTPPAALPAVEVFAVDPRASEQAAAGSAGPDTAVFRFRRSGPTNDALAVSYLVSGTAENGVDYATLGGTAVIPAGKVSESVEVVPAADGVAEPIPETVVLAIATNSPHHVAGPRREAAAYIVDTRWEPATTGLPGGELMVEIATPIEGLVSVQVSTNLVDWTHVCTVNAGGGRARFVDPEARGLTRRFYQVMPAPIHLESLDD